MRERVEDLLLDMKDTSELMIDLAYSALFYGSKQIAQEVRTLEQDVDDTLLELQRAALDAVKQDALTTDEALVLLRVAQGAETFANSALEIADVVLRDVELHPVLRASIQESDSTITKVTLATTSEFVDQSLRDLELETDTGMRIIAVRRGRNWKSRVHGDFLLRADDLIVATGPHEAEEAFLARCDPSGLDEEEELPE